MYISRPQKETGQVQRHGSIWIKSPDSEPSFFPPYFSLLNFFPLLIFVFIPTIGKKNGEFSGTAKIVLTEGDKRTNRFQLPELF